MLTKKLIEVALPLEKMNEASAREKTIRHGHPANLHLWWARRPLVTARAIIWASLVDDPSSHPELYPTEEAQIKERQRLFDILCQLVTWENSNNEVVLSAAKEEIKKSLRGGMPTLLDPFAGGGAIPLEAQRLGLKPIAHDLNPVAVMINKAMIDLPERFANIEPVNPNIRSEFYTGWDGINGLAEDVQYYGEWMRTEAFKSVGKNYPKVKLPSSYGGGEATVIAWLWARVVKCPNPACSAEAPLIHSYILSKRKGKEAYIEPVFKNGEFTTKIVRKKFAGKEEGTVARKGAICACCGLPIDFNYIRDESKAGRMYCKMTAVVAEGKAERIYLEPDETQRMAVEQIHKPDSYPDAELAYYPGHLNTNAYGLNTFDKLFTNRQLKTLTTFSGLITNVQKQVEKDAVNAGMANDHISLADGGTGAQAYGEAISVYLTFCIDKMIDLSNALNRWEPNAQCPRQLFARQAIPMVWDFAESNIFSNSSGAWNVHINNFMKSVRSDSFDFKRDFRGEAEQQDAQTDCGLRDIMISMDPPYYDNIGYADLSDFFYVWMRQSLKNTFPNLFKTMVVPKKEELVATQYRFDGSVEKARDFFENGMLQTCKEVYKYAADDIPVTIYYAYKQSNTEGTNEGEKTASTGWETMLSAIIEAGFSITGTWPVKTECSSRSISQGANALASSIVLVCRKRETGAQVITRRNFINMLKRELRPALKKLQESNIAPVDLAQSAIGPGMGVYSKYAKVLEADGTPMTVRSALYVINQELDLFLNEQDGELDTESRFCVDLYSQMAFNEMPFGDANTLATAKNTSVAIMASHGTLYAQKGKVHLIERQELPAKINEHEGSIWLLCQQLTYKMEKEGIEGCAAAIANMYGSNAERAKDLAYRLYTIAERKKWAQEAYAYNALVVAWPEIQSRAAELKAIVPQQLTLEDFMNNNN